MKQTSLSSFKTRYNVVLFTLTAILFLGLWTSAKADNPYVITKTLSFKQSLGNNYELTPFIHWTITQKNSNTVIASGDGNTLSSYIFNIPGEYSIALQNNTPNYDPNDHDEVHYPDIIEVSVSPVRITFDMNSIALSDDIIGGKDMNGSTVTITIQVDIFNNQPVVYPHPYFRSAGVRTTIEGALSNPNTVLMPGINILQYNLTGVATSGSYIMFDFLDYNGDIQCYYKPEMIP